MKQQADSTPQQPPASASTSSKQVLADTYKDKGKALPGQKGAFCARCGRHTNTVFLPLHTGHIGNLCAVCHTCRKGRPYISKREYRATKPPIGESPEGVNEDNITEQN